MWTREIDMRIVIYVQPKLNDINLLRGKLAIFTGWSMLTLKMLLNGSWLRVLGQKTNITHLPRWCCAAREASFHDENGLKLLLASYLINRGPYTGWLKAHESNLSKPRISQAMAFQSNCRIERKWRKLQWYKPTSFLNHLQFTTIILLNLTFLAWLTLINIELVRGNNCSRIFGYTQTSAGPLTTGLVGFLLKQYLVRRISEKGQKDWYRGYREVKCILQPLSMCQWADFANIAQKSWDRNLNKHREVRKGSELLNIALGFHLCKTRITLILLYKTNAYAGDS